MGAPDAGGEQDYGPAALAPLVGDALAGGPEARLANLNAERDSGQRPVARQS